MKLCELRHVVNQTLEKVSKNVSCISIERFIFSAMIDEIGRKLQINVRMPQMVGQAKSNTVFYGKGVFHSFPIAWLFGAIILVSACGSGKEPLNEAQFNQVPASSEDELAIAKGFSGEVLIRSMDSIGDTKRFGYDVSGLVYVADGSGDGTLWVNHELIKPMFTSGYYGDIARLRKHIDIERAAVGATALRISRDGATWSYKRNDNLHQRLDAATEVALDSEVNGKQKARGTTANKSMLFTPWKTVLSAEAGYEQYYGDYDWATNKFTPGIFRWASFFRDDPRLYGWIVETDPVTGIAQKLTDLGRLKRNGLALELQGEQVIVYFTERDANGYLFRYVVDRSSWPVGGTLSVADLNANRWTPIIADQPSMTQVFGDDPMAVKMNLREAARIVGGTTFDNPGGLAISPIDGKLYMATASDLEIQSYHGGVLVFANDGEDFSWDTIVEGGEETGVSCPAELQFDNTGNLWVATAIPSQLMNSGVYEAFGNNSLFVLPKGQNKPVRIATMPTDARIGGMSFAENDEFLFLSVQQPGARSKSIYDFDFTSHWPDGGNAMPKSSVVVLSRE